MPQRGVQAQDISVGIQEQRLPAWNERKDRGNDNERSRYTRYRTGLKDIANYRNKGIKKTEKFAKQINEDYLKNREKETVIDVEIRRISAEMDEMWSYCHNKSNQLWLWWAVEHETNTPLAYTFGTREHKYLDELLALLKPFPIGTVYADNNYAYKERLSADILITGKKNTQKIERDHLTLRTRIKRLARKTICFSKNKDIHIAVIGTFINIFFFGRNFDASTIL